MSIGICDLRMKQARLTGLSLLCCVSLSACVDGANGFSFAPKIDSADASTGLVIPKTTSTTLARGAVKVTSPKGYCIDKSSIKNGLQGSSALLAACSALDGKGAGNATAVMSLQISARRGNDAAKPTAIDLAKAAQPRRVVKSVQKGDLALVQIASGGDDALEPADPVHWRGATALDTRLVLLGLFAPEGSKLASDDGADLLAALARGLSATRVPLLGRSDAQQDSQSEETSGDTADQSTDTDQPKDVASDAAADRVEQEEKDGAGFIARLLNGS